MLLIIAGSVIVSFLFTHFSIKKLIYVAHRKHLFDDPSEDRKVHILKTPNIGGIAIFAACVFTASIFSLPGEISEARFLVAAALILFVVGLTDDLVGVTAWKKLLAQIVAVCIISTIAGAHFTNLHGFLGIWELPLVLAHLLSIVTMLLIVNAFNLIDGIDCLAGSQGLLAALVFAICFYLKSEYELMLLALILGASMLSFLTFNLTPAKIFMGDTGSLFVGLILAYFGIKLLSISPFDRNITIQFFSNPIFLIALLVVPLFDTCRIFLVRIARRRSPFAPDRNHIHHRLIAVGLNHLQSTCILFCFTVVSVIGELALSGADMFFQIVALAAYLLTGEVLLLKLDRDVRNSAAFQPSLSNVTIRGKKPSCIRKVRYRKEYAEAIENI